MLRPSDFPAEMVSPREGAAAERGREIIMAESPSFVSRSQGALVARARLPDHRNWQSFDRSPTERQSGGAARTDLDRITESRGCPSFLIHLLARMPRLTLSFKESLYREILNGRDNDPANLHPARRDQPAGLGLFFTT